VNCTRTQGALVFSTGGLLEANRLSEGLLPVPHEAFSRATARRFDERF
jgi:hypothetical protein